MKYVPKAVTRAVGNTVLKTKVNSPQLLFAAGLVGFGTTVVLACKATMRVEDVLVSHEKNKLEIDRNVHSAKANNSEQTALKAQTALKLAKLYTPAIVCGTVSVYCLTKSHRILNDRNATLTAAYVGLQKFLDDYRGRVREKVGEADEKDIYYASTPVELVEDTPNGPKKIFGSRPNGASPYSCIFDDTKENIFQEDRVFNEHYIRLQADLLTDKLRSVGHLFLNDVYDVFGVEHTATGQLCGWYVGHPDSDDFVEISITPLHDYHNSLLLDFNVAGNVVSMLKDHDYRDQISHRKAITSRRWGR